MRRSYLVQGFLSVFTGISLFGLITGVALVFSASLHARAADAPKVELGPGNDWLASMPRDLDGAFRAVAHEVRFEPYPGVLRGALGTAIAGSGNSWDKALLLAELLRQGGYEVRFAQGTLEAGNLSVLIRGSYPPMIPDPALGQEYAPYDPAFDPALRAATDPHVWLEVNQGESWLPLDPSFPRAKIGEAYAVATRHFTAPPVDAFQRVRVVWKEENGAGIREVAQFDGRAVDLSLVPISFSATGVPLQKRKPKTGKSGAPAGLFGDAMGGGALGGSGGSAPADPEASAGAKAAGTLIRRTIHVGDRTQEAAETLVQEKDHRSRLIREWMEITLSAPGQPDRTARRPLLGRDAALSQDELQVHRRYSLGVFAGGVPLKALEEQLTQARALPLDAWQDDAGRLAKGGPDGARSAAGLEAAVGRTAGHLLTLTHAQASDALSDRLARHMGVVVLRERPRVLIATMEVSGGAEPTRTVSLDLRIDEVRAIPWPGQAARAARLFLLARGIQSSAIEGEVVSAATGQPAVTTAALMARARAENVELVEFSAGTRHSEVAKLTGLNEPGRTLLNEALARGMHVVVPENALAIAGRERVGFWEIDPGTGAVIGVMDDGLHQSMVQHSVNTSKIGLDEDTGLVLGMMSGATTTIGLLAGKILEHGAVTQQVLEDVKKLAENVACYSCPKVEAKAEGKVKIGDDCLKVEKKIEGKASLEVEGFCKKYAEGFKCAMGMLLAAYADDGTPFEAEGKVEIGAEAMCNKWPKDDKKKDGK